MGSKDKVSIAFMKDMADDLSRKKSAFWNCKVDAFLCPVCAFVYALCPLGFNLLGNRFVFLNTNVSIDGLIQANKKNNYVYKKIIYIQIIRKNRIKGVIHNGYQRC